MQRDTRCNLACSVLQQCLSSENLPPPTFFSVVIMAAKLLSGTIGTNSMDSQCKKINGLNIAEREMSAGLPSPR